MALTGKRQAHVLALPFPFQGHINPLLDLSCKLATEGIIISFVNIPYYHSRLLPSLQTLFDRDRLPIRLLSLRSASPPPPNLCEHGSLERFLHHVSAFMLPEVEDVMHSIMQQDHPPTCLLADVRMPFAQCLAEKFSIARIAFWTQSAASFLYHAALAEGFQPPKDEFSVIDCIPGVPAHTAPNAPIIFRREIIGDFIYDFLMKPFSEVKKGLGLVINTFESLESEAMEALRAHGWNPCPVGPLLPVTYFDKAAEVRSEEKHMCLEWLDARQVASVVYISFGTLVCLDEAEFEELALGIEASEQSFLWSLRSDAVRGDPSSFIEAFKERTKHRGLVVPWVPQFEVLMHASIGGFITHCGWNSSMESMCRGVPMIGWPKFGEQKLNLMCLVNRWKVCLAMEGEAGSLQRDEVERNVRTLLVEPDVEELRRSAEKVQNAEAFAVAANGTSFCSLKLLLKLVSSSI